MRDPELADGDRAARRRRRGAVLHGRHRRGGRRDWVLRARRTLTREDLAAYADDRRASPVRVRYRGREVLTNPPPSAGGVLIAYASNTLTRCSGKEKKKNVLLEIKIFEAA